MALQGAHGGHHHRRRRPESRGPALNVKELLAAHIHAEAGLGDDIVGHAQADLVGQDRRVALGDVGERPGVDEGWRALDRLHQVRLEGLAHQHGGRAGGAHIIGADRPPARVERHHHLADARPQAADRVGGRVAGGQGQDGHQLAGHGDVEAGGPRGAVGLAALADGDVAQEAVVHIDHAADGDPRRVDAQGVAVVPAVVNQGRDLVVGLGHGVDVAVEVDDALLQGHHLRVAAAGAAALDAEDRAERALAQGDRGVLADPAERHAQADRRRGLALAEGRGRDRGDEDVLAERSVAQGDEGAQVDLGPVAPVRLDKRFGDAQASSGTNVVSGNFIYNLSVSSVSTLARIYGLNLNGGATSYINNIINLGGISTPGQYLIGISENGASLNAIYFNTIYIGGTTSGVTSPTFALLSASTNSRNFRNNILFNARSGGSQGNHYAVCISSTTGLTIDYNDYFVTGSGGILGGFGTIASRVNKTTLAAWQTTTAQDVNSLSIDPLFGNPGTSDPAGYYPDATLFGVTGTGTTTDYFTITRGTPPTMGAIDHGANIVDVFKGGVLQASYPNLKGAFDKINNGTHKNGDLQVRINESTVETATAVLYQSGYVSGSTTSGYSSVTVFATKSGVSVTGNLGSPLIDLNGADNVTFDGRPNATGSAIDLTMVNASTSNGTNTSTIRLINGATFNTFKYCNIKGSTTRAASGIIYFATSTTTGNSNNTFDHNQMSSNNGNRPVNVIYSAGTSTRENTLNTISNNLIFDFFRPATASQGIYLSTYTSDWTISGNSFYETSAFAATSSVTYYAIRINNTAGSGFAVTGNFIGGSSANAGGTAWTKTGSNNIFYGIYLNAGTTTVNSIQGNTIANINYTNTGNAIWTAVHVAAGSANIGTTTGNTIGSGTGNGSLSITAGASGASVYAINITSTAAVGIENNTIGSINLANSANSSTHFYGVLKSAVDGALTVRNNLIGSLTTANSIISTSVSTSSAQKVYGINSACTGTVLISGNTISNITNSYSGTGNTSQTRGILVSGGVNSILNNIVKNISTSSAQTTSGTDASVIGIAMTSTLAGQAISGNKIENLANLHTSAKGYNYGILYSGPASGTNVISGNFISTLTMSTTDRTSEIDGIFILSGISTYYNNIINLGTTLTTGFVINGIQDYCDATCNNSFYFNTVYIGGTVASGITSATYAVFLTNATGTSVYKDNLMINTRSGGTTGKHYGIGIPKPNLSQLGIDYNDYYVTGTNGVLGTFNNADKTTLAAWQAATGQDVHSISLNPQLVNPGTGLPLDYRPVALLPGLTITGISVDFGGTSRSSTPTMGAWERFSLIRKWKGNISTDFAIGGNWTDGTVPSTGEDIIFDDNPDRHCILDQNRTVGSIYNGQSVDMLVTNGKKLTILGSLNFTNGAKIDASASASEVSFSGAVMQSIPAGSFNNNEIYNLTVNNALNVVLSGTLRLTNVVTTTSGKLDVYTSSATMEYGGSAAQTVDASTFLTGKIYNLKIDNAVGLTMTSNLVIYNDLTINSGKKFIVPSTRNLTVAGNINNSGTTSGFILKSDISGTASLLHNTSLVPATAERYISGSTEVWHLMSSPVSSQNIDGSWTPSGTYGNGTGYDLYVWDEPTSCWIFKLNTTSANSWPVVHPQSNFIPGKGYLYSFQETNPTKQFLGGLNNGTVSYTVTNLSSNGEYNGFNLLGNPYPSSIDWKAASGWTRTNLVNSGGGYDMWIWNPAANNYGVYNSANSGDAGTNNVTRYVAPMQGYFVRAASQGNVVTTNEVRTHLGAGNWFKSASKQAGKFSLTANSLEGAGYDESLLEFGFNQNEDGAMKLSSNVATAPGLFLPVKDNNLSVRYLTSPGQNPEIPVDFLPGKDGNYSLIFRFMPEDYETVMLEDLFKDYIQDLKNNPVYLFSAAKTDDPGRFILHFGAADKKYSDKLPARIYVSHKFLAVDLALVQDQSELTVYDITGRLILSTTLNGKQIHYLELASPKQFLIVKLRNNNGSRTQKIFWNEGEE